MDSVFDILLEDSCVDSFHLVVSEDQEILDCSFRGPCAMDLRILANNLIGESLEDACSVIESSCCEAKNRPCVDELKATLCSEFEKIAEELD